MSRKEFVGPTYTETASGVILDLANPQPEDINIGDIAWGLSRQNRFAGHTISKKPYTVAQHTVQVSYIAFDALMPGNEFNDMFKRYIDKALTNILEEHQADSEVFKIWSGFQDRLRLADYDDHKHEQIAFHALMHDFAEAYLIDIPTPVKRLPGVYEAYHAAEERMDMCIFKKFGLVYADKWPGDRVFGEIVVKWADMLALKIEAYHMMPSRGLAWNLPQEQPSLQMLNAFRWPINSEEACAELLARFEELKPADQIYG